MLDLAIIRCHHTFNYNNIDRKEDTFAASIAAVAVQEGWGFEVYDFYLDPDISLDSVIRAQPKIIIVVVRETADNFFYTLKFAGELRRKLNPTPTLILYGQTHRVYREALRCKLFNFVVVGEEQELRLLLSNFAFADSPCRMQDVPGLAYLDPVTGALKLTKPLPLNKQLDDLPSLHHYHLEKLLRQDKPTHHLKVVIEASRGCYAACNFCFIQATDHIYKASSWRGRSPKRIVDEIEAVVERYAAHDFYFHDSNFFGPGSKGRETAQEIAREIIRRNLDIAFFIYARADNVDFETFSLLRRAGLKAVYIGIESFSQAVLDRYNKGVTVQQNIKAINVCKELDIYVHMGFITYDYFTTLAELRENISYLKHLLRDKPHLIASQQFLFGFIFPLEGTPLADDYVRQGIIDYKTRYDFPQFLIPDLLLKVPVGPYKIRDHRVALIAETTRLLAYECQKKTVRVHRLLEQGFDRMAGISPLSQIEELEHMVRWNENLTPKMLELFEFIVEGIADAVDPDLDRHPITEEVYRHFTGYNRRWLSEEDSVPETYSRHYLKLRDRQEGMHSWSVATQFGEEVLTFEQA